jgi:hypothetical protein
VREQRAALEAVCRLTRAQKRVLTDIAQCRTAALGGHLDVCQGCGYEHPSYNSCRNRHCPKCQALAAEVWIDKRSERLLDVGHYHVVFTLPAELRPLAKLAPELLYAALFAAASHTLLELGHERLDATLGATLVLHTWTRDLRFHPHLHAIVTAGGLAPDGTRFQPCRARYLFPVKVMGLLLRGKLLAALGRAHAAGAFAGFQDFDDPAAFPRLVARLRKLNWNVYAKAPFKKSKHVLAYLGRYTHRVGIANSRLLDVTDELITFRTKGDGTATVTPVEFLRRFVQHVLPDGFHKIRHIGLYASPRRLALARERLVTPTSPASAPKPRARPSWQEHLAALTQRDVRRCPVCDAPLIRISLPPLARGPPRERRRRRQSTEARPLVGGQGRRLARPRKRPCPSRRRTGGSSLASPRWRRLHPVTPPQRPRRSRSRRENRIALQHATLRRSGLVQGDTSPAARATPRLREPRRRRSAHSSGARKESSWVRRMVPGR